MIIRADPGAPECLRRYLWQLDAHLFGIERSFAFEPHGLMALAARDLRALFGMPVVLAYGLIRLDRPFVPPPSALLSSVIADLSGYRVVPHCWVEIRFGGRWWALDILADRFNQFLEIPLPPLLLVSADHLPSCYQPVERQDYSDYEPTESDRHHVIQLLGLDYLSETEALGSE